LTEENKRKQKDAGQNRRSDQGIRKSAIQQGKELWIKNFFTILFKIYSFFIRSCNKKAVNLQLFQR